MICLQFQFVSVMKTKKKWKLKEIKANAIKSKEHQEIIQNHRRQEKQGDSENFHNDFIEKKIYKKTLNFWEHKAYLCCGLTHLCQVIIHFKNCLLQDFLRIFKSTYECICIWLQLVKFVQEKVQLVIIIHSHYYYYVNTLKTDNTYHLDNSSKPVK